MNAHHQERRERLNAISHKHIKSTKLSRSYSAFVGVMRYALPMLGLTFVTLLFLWPSFNQTPYQDIVTDHPKNKVHLEHIEMVAPDYQGFDKNLNPFSVRADKARRMSAPQDQIPQMSEASEAEPSMIMLDNPKAQIKLEARKDTIDVQALSGLYDQDQASLLLKGEVSLSNIQGYTLLTDKALVDLEQGLAMSKHPVQGVGPNGDIQSEGMTVLNNGEKVIFNGKSKLILR